MAVIGNYPSTLEGGPLPVHQMDYPPDFEVLRYRAEDGGMSVNVRPCGPVRIELEYEGLTEAEAVLLDDHYESAKGKTNTFSYFDRRAGITYTGVRYLSFEIVNHEKAASLARRIVLQRKA